MALHREPHILLLLPLARIFFSFVNGVHGHEYILVPWSLCSVSSTAHNTGLILLTNACTSRLVVFDIMSDCIVEENVWSCRLSGPSGSTTTQLPASYHSLVFVLLCFSGIVQWCTGTDVHAFCSEGCFCTQGDPRCNSSGGPSLDLAARVALVTRCRWRSPSSSTRETGAMSAASKMAEVDIALSSMTGSRRVLVYLRQGS